MSYIFVEWNNIGLSPLRISNMHMMSTSVAALAVSTIYCIWKQYFQCQLRREHTLRQRVAFMLWSAAMQLD